MERFRSNGVAFVGVNLRDVAKHASVSLSTASRALSGHPQVRPETRRRVLEAVRELRYDFDERSRERRGGPARGLLGFLVPTVATPFYGELLRYAQRAAFDRGYDLVIYAGDGHPTQNVVNRIAASPYLTGVIVVTPRHSEDEALKELATGLSVVILDHRAEGSGFPHVTVDNLRAAHRATAYLVGQGRRRIGMITGSLAVQSAMDRLRGYRLALEEAGIRYDESLVLEGDFETPVGYALTRDWIGSGRALPEAIFCANDLMAVGALQALAEAGIRVPEQVSVIGFDDLPVAATTSPSLTTVAQPFQEMCDAAIRLLTRLIKGEEPDTDRVVLDAQLVIREST